MAKQHVIRLARVIAAVSLMFGLAATPGMAQTIRGTVTSRFTGTAVPEPASVSLLGCGLLALLVFGKQRNRNDR